MEEEENWKSPCVPVTQCYHLLSSSIIDDDEEDGNRLEGGDAKEPVEGDEGKVGPEFDQNQNQVTGLIL